MKKKQLLSFALLIILISSCRHPASPFEKFDQLFTTSTTDTTRITAITPPSQNDSLITGKIIPRELYSQIEFPLKTIENDSSKNKITALKKIALKDRIAYLIWFNNKSTGVPDCTCLYLYNNSTGKMGPPQIIQYSNGSEGSEAFTESWIFDLDKDGSKDLVMRNYECTLLGEEGAYSNFSDTLIAGSWTNDDFKIIIPENYKTLKQALHVDCICACGFKN